MRLALIQTIVAAALGVDLFVPANSALAVACSPTSVTIVDDVSALGGTLTFYEDTGNNPPLRGMYVGYTITNNAATTSSDVWVTLDTFSGGGLRIGLGPNEDGVVHVGPLAPGASQQVYFYLVDASGSGSTAALNETFQVNLYPGEPSLTTEICDYTDTINAVEDDIAAVANKVHTTVSGPNPATLGGIMTMTVVGETGTIGAAQIFALTPAADPDWPANSYQLVDVHIDYWNGTTCPDTSGSVPGGAPTHTFDDRLIFNTPGGTNSCYRIVYTFVATGVTSAPTSVLPVNHISSGTQIKHTGAYVNPLQPIQPASNTTTLSKSVTPSILPTGGSVTYTVTISSTGAVSITLDLLRDTLPAGVTYSANTSQYNGSPIANPFISGQVLTWSGLFVLPPNSTRTLTYQATVPNTPGSYTNSVVGRIGSTQIDTTAITTDNAPATSMVTVGAADLSIVKSDTPDPVNAGQLLTYTLVVANAGASDAANVTVTDTLPAGVTFVSATPPQSSGPNPLVWNLGTLNAGASTTLTVVVTLDSGATGTLTNTATVGSTTPDPDPTDNSDTELTTVSTSADLSIVKSDNPDPVVAGQTLTYTLTVNNAGPSNAANVIVTDTLPAGVTLVSVSSSQGGCVALPCNLGTLNAGASATVTIVVTVNAGTSGTLTNTAGVSSTTPDPDPSDNTDGETTNVNTLADLSLVKVANVPTPTIGSNVIYTVAVSNAGPSIATNVSVTDVLPAAVTFVSATPSQGTYNPATGLWSIGTIGSGASASLQIVATVNSTGAFTNTAQVAAADQPDPDSTPGNSNPAEDDQDSVTLPSQVADLSLLKSVSPASVTVGQNVTFTIVITNSGPDTATGVEVSDALPAGLTFQSASTGQGSYSSATGVWTVGTLASGATATLQIVVTVNNIGAITNTAQVSDMDQLDPDSIPGNSNPAEDDQSSVAVIGTEDPVIGLAKTVASATDNGDGTYTVVYTLTVENLGSVLLNNVQVQDNLATTFPAPTATFTVNSVSSAGLITNPSYNGSSDTNLLASGNTLVVGANATIVLSVRVAPGSNLGPYNNSAASSAVGPAGTPTTDTSDNGIDPDPDGDGDPNEPTENDSTPITFVPTAVELLYFRVDGVSGRQVNLAWATAVEIDNFGFNLYRAPVNDFSRATWIHFEPSAIKGSGSGATYLYADMVPFDGVWWYWLADVDTQGIESINTPVSAVVGADTDLPFRVYLPIISEWQP